jgi:HlyD family secretion protein
MIGDVRGTVPASLLVIAFALQPSVGCRARSEAPVVKTNDEPGLRRIAGALGRVEPASGVVNVGSLPGEQIRRLLVAVGDHVEKGGELARLTSDELRTVEYEAACLQLDEAQKRAEAQRQVAAATLAEAELGGEQAAAADLEIVGQQTRIKATRENAEVARQELQRLNGLEPRLVPAQALARKQLFVKQAELELEIQEAALKRMHAAATIGRRAAAARLESAKANAALVDAGSSLATLEKAAAAARLRRDLSIVRSPTTGRVLDIMMREGEIVGPRPIMRIADVSRMQVVAEVYETDVRSIRLGQPAEVRSRAIDGVLTGRVVQIGTLVSPHDVQELGMPATTERRVVDVRIDLDDPALAARLIQLQVDVDFLAADGDALPRGDGRP